MSILKEENRNDLKSMTSAPSFRDWKKGRRVNPKYVRKEIIEIKIEIMKYKRGNV